MNIQSLTSNVRSPVRRKTVSPFDPEDLGASCLVDELEEFATTYPGIKAFRKGVDEFRTYVTRNAGTIASYAERHRYGEWGSTAFAESTVNKVVGKRFSKRQQMRWSKRGAHLMLQTRTRVLDGTLKAKFQSWYPGLSGVQTPDHSEHERAA